MSEDPTKELLTEAELAKRWRVTVRTLYRYRMQGMAPPNVGHGRKRLYRLSDIKAMENRSIIENGGE